MKTWFIAGEARGLNTHIAKRVLESGGRVVATGKEAQSLADLLGTRPDLLPVPVHPNNEYQAKRAVRLAVKRFGRIDVVINGFNFGLLGAVEEISAAEVEWAFRSNVFGLLTMTRAVLPQLRAQRSGRILNLSSVGGYRSAKGRGVYCSTKFAVEGLSEALHDELEPLGIDVTVIELGEFQSDSKDAASVRISEKAITDYNASSARRPQIVVRPTPHELSDPQELAKVIVDFADVPKPPVRLPLGYDTVAAMEAKIAADNAILAEWRTVSVSGGSSTDE